MVSADITNRTHPKLGSSSPPSKTPIAKSSSRLMINFPNCWGPKLLESLFMSLPHSPFSIHQQILSALSSKYKTTKCGFLPLFSYFLLFLSPLPSPSLPSPLMSFPFQSNTEMSACKENSSERDLSFGHSYLQQCT